MESKKFFLDLESEFETDFEEIARIEHQSAITAVNYYIDTLDYYTSL